MFFPPIYSLLLEGMFRKYSYLVIKQFKILVYVHQLLITLVQVISCHCDC